MFKRTLEKKKHRKDKRSISKVEKIKPQPQQNILSESIQQINNDIQKSEVKFEDDAPEVQISPRFNNKTKSVSIVRSVTSEDENEGNNQEYFNDEFSDEDDMNMLGDESQAQQSVYEQQNNNDLDLTPATKVANIPQKTKKKKRAKSPYNQFLQNLQRRRSKSGQKDFILLNKIHAEQMSSAMKQATDQTVLPSTQDGTEHDTPKRKQSSTKKTRNQSARSRPKSVSKVQNVNLKNQQWQNSATLSQLRDSKVKEIKSEYDNQMKLKAKFADKTNKFNSNKKEKETVSKLSSRPQTARVKSVNKNSFKESNIQKKTPQYVSGQFGPAKPTKAKPQSKEVGYLNQGPGTFGSPRETFVLSRPKSALAKTKKDQKKQSSNNQKSTNLVSQVSSQTPRPESSMVEFQASQMSAEVTFKKNTAQKREEYKRRVAMLDQEEKGLIFEEEMQMRDQVDKKESFLRTQSGNRVSPKKPEPVIIDYNQKRVTLDR